VSVPGVIAAPSEPLLAVTNLIKHFSLRRSWLGGSGGVVPAVDGISFKILSETTLALVGESGCGKSTTARLVMQLEVPDAGEIWLDGEAIRRPGRADLKRLRRKAQMVFQDPYASLTPHMRIGSILRESFLVHKLCSRREIGERVAAALASVGLHLDVAGRYPHELSGGQRQRVGIARAIAVEPRLIVCDEPVSALDVSIRSQIINLLLDLQRSRGLAYLFISHDLVLVEHVADFIAVMYLGKIVEYAPTREFFAGPKHPYSQALLASSPVPDPRQRRRPAPLRGEVASSTELPSGCRFRTRCPLVIARCVESEPPLRLVGTDHLSACHRAEEVHANLISA
jgi:peptide/nickel transport system ATP-binding protein/oligopeptide transport system ATP-binding protein